MAISLVQSNNTSATGSASTLALAYGSNTSPGSALYAVAAQGSNGSNTIALADTLNGSFSVLDTLSISTNWTIAHGWVANPSGGADTVTATFSAASIFRGLWIAEIGGSGGPDLSGSPYHNANFQTSGTAITSGNLTPSAQPGLCIGFTLDGNLVRTFTAGSGFTDLTPTTCWASFGGKFCDAEYQIYSALSSIPAAFTISAASNLVGTVGALFLPSGGGGPGVSAPMYYRKNVLYFI
jgi:hypothetical protein